MMALLVAKQERFWTLSRNFGLGRQSGPEGTWNHRSLDPSTLKAPHTTDTTRRTDAAELLREGLEIRLYWYVCASHFRARPRCLFARRHVSRIPHFTTPLRLENSALTLATEERS